MKKEGAIVSLTIDNDNSSETYTGKISVENTEALKKILHAFYDSEKLKYVVAKEKKESGKK